MSCLGSLELGASLEAALVPWVKFYRSLSFETLLCINMLIGWRKRRWEKGGEREDICSHTNLEVVKLHLIQVPCRPHAAVVVPD